MTELASRGETSKGTEFKGLFAERHPVEQHVRQGFTVLCIPSVDGEREIGPTVVSAKAYVDRVLVYDAGTSGQNAAVARKAGAFIIASSPGRTKEEVMSELLVEAMASSPAFVVVMDLDRNNDPAFIPKLTSPLMRGETDITIGVHEQGGVLALRANLFAMNSRALSTTAGSDFFRSMAGGDDRELAEAGLKMMAVFFDTTAVPRARTPETKAPTINAEEEAKPLRLFWDDRLNAMGVVLGAVLAAAGGGLMAWAIWGFISHYYANTMLMVLSATLVIVGVMLAISSSLHFYLQRLVR